MKNVMDILRERGFVKQTVFEEDLYRLLEEKSVTFYIGFDPTADSLHVGHFVQLMAMAHMQRAGHRPIALIGGGTGMIGDPSGRTDLRSVMTSETVAYNCECFKKQMERFIDFSDGKALMLNNADWLCGLNYIDFLRSIGTHFSVNKMLTAECYKKRLEKGLTFLEFNYMLMQAYDFLVLNEKYGCELQLGGDDQWSNMLAGADLIRRKLSKPAFAMTFSLLTTSEGTKMGKTAKGAVWLDKNKTSPYDFYQYWRNVDDADVEKCLKLLTFLPVEEIAEMCRYKDQRINDAKVKLAYELTKIVHGREEADKAKAQAEAAFSDDAGNMPCMEIPFVTNIIDVLTLSQVAKSRGDARRLIDGGGVTINDFKITDYGDLPSEATEKREFVLHKGKKVHIKIVLK
ncbi:MAG: tyrosine--tRNA ligase [Clostridia bacterium]|nr:tyrosine--tRNA ligase [Clostridia bacterium]